MPKKIKNCGVGPKSKILPKLRYSNYLTKWFKTLLKRIGLVYFTSKIHDTPDNFHSCLIFKSNSVASWDSEAEGGAFEDVSSSFSRLDRLCLCLDERCSYSSSLS